VTLNDQLIVPVFAALVEHKPKLAWLLPEEHEELDARRCAAEIVASYPWPIGVELRRLFSAGLEQPNRARLDQILKVVERAM